ncbi:uncharacterized protein LOC143454780 [Clavelina lepadiformis]|uniref:uncharacterized protein LOC143454780 n=1 Tax=Clavelina lepadiformis TaxID=159417 RepID=UPI004043756F
MCSNFLFPLYVAAVIFSNIGAHCTPQPSSKGLKKCLGICFCDWSTGLVDCSDLELNEIPFYLPQDVAILRLSSNKITKIKESDLHFYPSLQALYLDDNQISDIHHESFSNLPSLQIIDLSDNMISSWSANLTKGVSSTLKVLTLTKNAIGDVKSTMFGSLPQLEELHLVETAIRSIEDKSFADLTNLKVLNLKTNILNSLNPDGSTLDGLSSLEELYLDLNFFSEFPEAQEFGDARVSLRTLSFTGHQRTSYLTQLDFPALETFNASFCFLQKLENLTFQNTPQLLTLDIKGNKIQWIELEAFSGLEKLLHLDLSQNNLFRFPYAQLIPVSNSLKTLYADYLSIIQITNSPFLKNITFLSKLEYLSLSHTLLQGIDEDSFFQDLASLKILVLSDSKFTALPKAAIRHLTSLETLHFNGNLITNLTATSFPVTPSLKHLTISESSDLVKIDDDAFAGLSNLLSLSVNEGSLRYLSASAFSGLSRLKVLDISNNRLERAYPDWISDKNLEVFKLGGNRWICDCNTTGFQSWLSSDQYQQINSTDDPTCYTPRNLRGQQITNLPDSSLTCDEQDCPEMCLCYQQTQMNHIGGSIDIVETFLAATTVDCSNEDLSEVPDNMPLTSVWLSLDNNQLTGLQATDFHRTMSLQRLFLSNNGIANIENATLHELHELKELDLHGNNIQFLPSVLFQNLTDLESLRLDSNWIQELDENIFKELYNLLLLDLSNNNIHELKENVFDELTRLQRLVLSHNSIGIIAPATMAPLQQLDTLYMGNNPYVTLNPLLLNDLPLLCNLEVNGMRVDLLESFFLFSNSISYLKMESGYIPTIGPFAFAGLTNLRTLRLKNNYISNISDDAFFLSNYSSLLSSMDLTENDLEIFPIKVLSPLKKLDTLYLGKNPIRSLEYNASFQLPTTYLPSLKTLDLAFTELSKISQSSLLTRMTNVTTLVLNDCSFTQVPDAVTASLPHLTALVLDNNPIREINSSSFVRHKNLQYLNLRFVNELIKVGPSTFSNVQNLQSIQISGGGKLEDIDGSAFDGLSKLQVLDFSGNMLTKPKSEWFKDFDPSVIKSISMYDNSWICDCNSKEYRDWLQNGAGGITAYTTSIICQEPFYLKGTRLELVNDTSLCGTPSATVMVTIAQTTSSAINIAPMSCIALACILIIKHFAFGENQ